MAKIKEVSNNEIHWLLKDWNVKSQANMRIKQLLQSDSAYFAQVNVAGPYYTWNASDTEWLLLSSAIPLEGNVVREELKRLRKRVRTTLSGRPDIAEKILTVPNDDYVLYRIEEGGNVSLLLTGWGFRNFNKPSGGPIKIDPLSDKAHPVRISFIIDGQCVPNREFAVITSQKNVPHVTDDNGQFSFGEKVNPGKGIDIMDIPTKKIFHLVVDETRQEYDFDVTESVKINVRVEENGKPTINEEIRIAYAGFNYLLTSVNGKASKAVPFYMSEACVVKVREEEKSAFLNIDGYNEFFFEFTSQNENPEEKCFAPIICIKETSQKIFSDYPILVAYEGLTTEYISNEDGKVQLPEMISGKEIMITDGHDGNNVQAYILDAGQREYIFLISAHEELQEKISFSPIICIEDMDSDVVANYAISVEYDGRTTEYISNGDGRVQLPSMEPGKEMTVADGHNEQAYILDEDQKEYMFQISVHNEEPKEGLSFDPIICIEGIDGYIGSKYPVSVEYDGQVSEYVSNEEGKVLLPTMISGKEMTVTDGFDEMNKQVYVLDAEQKEYVFHIPYEPTQIGNDIKVTVKDIQGRPVKCARILFKQDDKQLLCTLDSDGVTYFGRDSFEYKKMMSAQMTALDRKFPRIDFALEENECEYELQEVKEKQPWWYRLVEVLVFAATATVLYFGADPIMDCISKLDNLIL